MRILVVSDTHGSVADLRQAVSSQPKAEVVIHLGDGAADAEKIKAEFPEKMFLQVKGNCDWGSSLPLTGEFIADGKKIFYTHGQAFGVKLGEYDVRNEARRRKADILLYGHTHYAFSTYRDELYIMNPGSLSGYGASYGIIDITNAGIVTNVVKL